MSVARKRFISFRQGRVSARRYAREQAQLRERLSRGMQTRVLAGFNQSLAAITRDIRDNQPLDPATMATRMQFNLNAVLKDELRKIFIAVYEYNAERYERALAKQFDFRESTQFESAVASYFAARVGFLRNLTRRLSESIFDFVGALRGEGKAVDEIARAVTKEYAPINRQRAALIARTETHSAAGQAHHSYHKQAADSYGIQMIKQWVSTADARTRANHAAMNGEKVAMDEDFLLPDGRRMGYVGDPRGGASNVINCRCVIIYVDADDEVLDDSSA